MKAVPRWLKEVPQELKTREGIESLAGLTPLFVTTDRCPDQTPEDEASQSGQSGQLDRRRALPTSRGDGSPTRRAGWVAGKPPEE